MHKTAAWTRGLRAKLLAMTLLPAALLAACSGFLLFEIGALEQRAIEALHAPHLSDATKQLLMESQSLAHKSWWIAFAFSVIGWTLALVFGTRHARHVLASLEPLDETLSETTLSLCDTSNFVEDATQNVATQTQKLAGGLERHRTVVHTLFTRLQNEEEVAHTAAESAHRGFDLASQGRSAAGAVLQDLNRIEQGNSNFLNASDRNRKDLEQIAQIFGEIERKTSVIGDIVLQTKLLSFNASVEAARAGEYGKGFSVVAEEIGNLAIMSGSSAKEITNLMNQSRTLVTRAIEDSQSSMRDLVEESRTRIQNGVRAADHCQKLVNEIVAVSERLDRELKTRETGAAERVRDFAATEKTLGRISDFAQRLAETARTAAEAAAQLNAETATVHDLSQSLDAAVSGPSKAA